MSGALKAYAVAAVALGGWFAGRLPAMVGDFAAERAALTGADRVRSAEPAAPAANAGLSQADAAALAAETARATVGQLIAAGWRPPAAMQPVAAGRDAVREVVRVVTVAQPAAQQAMWALPPGALPAAVPAASMPAPSPALAVASATTTGPGSPGAWARADAAYAALRRGDRRAAARGLSEAAALEGDTPRGRAWALERRRLTDRWVGEAYTLTRPGPGSQLAASPVLGGGQVGGTVAFTPDPLARRPVSVIARISAGQDASGRLDTDATEGAIGVRWRPFPALALDAERRFAVGAFGRGGWGLRASGGGGASARVAGVRLLADGYAEGGAVWRTGATILYAGGQARVGAPLANIGGLRLNAGAGAWAAGQYGGGSDVSRVDAGPSLRLSGGRLPFDVQADYRAKLGGNAAPGSGPVVTVTGNF